MKYAIIFLLVSILLLIASLCNPGIKQVFYLWGNISFTMVSIAYFGSSPSIFGKRSNGRLSIISVIALLPYLLLTWGTWHLLRIFNKKKAPYNDLGNGLIIGRRLLYKEYPANISYVIDLTCEFPEPRNVVKKYTYQSFPILDATAGSLSQMILFAKKVSEYQGNIYIHCAEGHGRTCLFTALLLLIRGEATDAEDAIQRIQSKRPDAQLSHVQKKAILEGYEILKIRIRN